MGAEARHDSFELPAHATSAGRARRRVRERLDGWALSPEDRDTAVLVVSELVTDVLLHNSGAAIVCELWAGNGRLQIEVTDQGGDGEPARLRPADGEVDNCHALRLVGIASKAWGAAVGRQGRGRVLWATLRTCPD
jgi:anti-sigma regulatory factor (Ser/Thr protein kinase)